MPKYFITRNGVKSGPYDKDSLAELKLQKTDLIWKEGADDWILGKDLEELSELIIPDMPKTPFELKSERLGKALKSHIYIPIILGVLLGLASLLSWNSVKTTVYDNKENTNQTWEKAQYIPYSKTMDKYLAGRFGYSPDKTIAQNENLYYKDTRGSFFRPLKAFFAYFNSETQFYVGKDESAPFLSFLLLSIFYCLFTYLLIFFLILFVYRFKT